MIVQKQKPCAFHNHLCYIYKNKDGKKYCKEGYFKTYPTKKIKPVSDKRKSEGVEYKKLRLQYLSEHPKCEINFDGCTDNSSDIHHRFSGKDRSKFFLDTTTWMASCRSCHNKIHSSDTVESYELGYLLHE